MNINILKNPIVIGIIMALITFGYLYWDNKRKQKKNPNINKKYDIITPLIVGAFTWFISANYFDNTIQPISNNVNVQTMISDGHILKQDGINSIIEPNYDNNIKIIGDDGINIQANANIDMPEMFIELDGFS
jgi:hypothetical protein